MGQLFSMLNLSFVVLLLFFPNTTLGESVSDMLERALPAVVTVGVYKSEEAKQAFGFTPPQADVAYRKVLDLAGVESTGSGFVIRHEGRQYIVTNAHVVEYASSDPDALFVYSITQGRYPMRVIGGDSFYDIAVLAFQDGTPAEHLEALSFRKDEIRIGETVYAIGNPGGDLPYTVTQGIIGGKNRVANGITAKFGYLQSTATIFSGNSGGPLIDAAGSVVGINSMAKMIDRQWQPQVNFALEAKVAERVVREILTNNGRVRRAFLGLVIGQDYPRYCVLIGECPNVQPTIVGVFEDGPASDLQDKVGAIILKVAGKPVRNLDEVLGEFEEIAPNSKVVLEVRHKGIVEAVSVTPALLTEQHLKSIGAYFVVRNGQLTLSETNEGVEIAITSPQRTELKYSEREAGFQEMTSDVPGEPVRIIAAGVLDENGEGPLWRVKSLVDLGIASRLASMSGRIDFVLKEGEEVVATRVDPAHGESVVRRILMY